MSMSDRTDRVRDELLALQDEEGKVNVAEAVRWARTHKKSALYAALNWDDADAAEQHRRWQVRQLIVVHIVDPTGGRRFVSLSIDRKDGGGYRPMDQVLARQDFREILLNDALADLQRLEARYKHLQELGAVWDATHAAAAKRQRPKAA